MSQANWGGYAFCPSGGLCQQNESPNGSGISWVQGIFTVPNVTCAQNCSSKQAISVWVGVGGFVNNTSLMQVGVEQDWYPHGGWEAYAWYTMNTTSTHMFGVRDGDTVVVALWFNGWLHGMQNWVFYAYDRNTQSTFTVNEACGGVGSKNCTSPSGFQSADWIIEAPQLISGATAELPSYQTFPFSFLQYGNDLTGVYHYLGNASYANVIEIEQSYMSARGASCYGAHSGGGVYYCQIGVYPTAVFGTGTSSVFYAQYLVGTVGLGTPSVSPTSGGPGTMVIGSIGIYNPAIGYPIEGGSIDKGTGGVVPINLSIEMAITRAGGGSTVNVTVQSTPYFAAFDPLNGYCYVADYGTNYVSVVANGSVIASIYVGSHPLAPAYDPYNSLVYVPISGANFVVALRGTSVVNASWNPIVVGASPHSVEFDSYNGEMYVANYGSATVSAISGGTRVSSTFTVGSDPLFAVPAGKLVYVDNSGSSSVSVINASSGSVQPVTVGQNPHYAVWDPANGFVYVPNTGSGTVSILSQTSNKFTVQVGSSPQFAAFDPQDGYVYIANNGGSTVSVINGSSLVPNGGTITVGSSPLFPFYDSDNSQVYVTNVGSNSVSVIGGSGGTTVVGTISVGQGPHGITMNLQYFSLYVVDGSGAQVTVLDPNAARQCNDSGNASYVTSGLVIGTGTPSTKLSVCTGLPKGVYLFQFIVWWDEPNVPVGGGGIGASQLMAKVSWSYSWGKYFTVT